jgi:hypothetical protein
LRLRDKKIASRKNPIPNPSPKGEGSFMHFPIKKFNKIEHSVLLKLYFIIPYFKFLIPYFFIVSSFLRVSKNLRAFAPLRALRETKNFVHLRLRSSVCQKTFASRKKPPSPTLPPKGEGSLCIFQFRNSIKLSIHF